MPGTRAAEARRRTAPGAATGATAAVVGVASLLVAGAAVALAPWTSALCAPVAAWSGARLRDARGVVAVAASGLVAAVVTGALVPQARPTAYVTVQLLLLWWALPWLLGRAWGQRQRLARAEWAALERMQREERLLAERARLRERTRIAEDVHDGLGHDLSLIALRAGALELAPDLPEAHRRAAAELRLSAAAAVERLGGVVGLLRDGAPAPLHAGPGSVLDLVEGARASGMAVELVGGDGALEGAAPAVRAAAVRVVQEALTNAARHAPGAPVAVTVVREGGTVAVEVANGAATGLPATGGGGRGLHALRERARLAGGSLEAGARGRGFAVGARLPLGGAAPLPPGSEADPGTAEGVGRVRAAAVRARRRLAVAVAVPVGVVLLLAAALEGDALVATSRAVLPRGDYDALRTGQLRDDLGGLLPSRQLTGLPPGARAAAAALPPPPGATCEHYALGVDLLSGRAQDAYRLCFLDGRLVAKDVLVAGGTTP